MDDDVDDKMTEVVYTDSQNSIPIEMICYETIDDVCLDSTGRDTYILEIDDSLDTINSEGICSVTVSTTSTSVPCLKAYETPTSYYTFVQETFTQTSKTVIEVAKAEMLRKVTNTETQTSLLRLLQNKTENNVIQNTEISNTAPPKIPNNDYINDLLNNILNKSLEYSSNYPAGDTEHEDMTSDTASKIAKNTYKISDLNTIDKCIKTKFEEGDRMSCDDCYESDSDYEEDSLMEDVICKSASKSPEQSSIISDAPQSIDNEIKELYDKISASLVNSERCDVEDEKKGGYLTTLSEEVTPLPSNLNIDTIKPTAIANTSLRNDADDFFLNSLGFQIKLLPQEHESQSTDAGFKLPPINRNSSCSNSPHHLNLLLTVNKPFVKADALPCLFKVQKENLDRWKIYEYSSGENGHSKKKEDIIKSSDNNLNTLPPIRTIVGEVQAFPKSRPMSYRSNDSYETRLSTDSEQISIKSKIRDLKLAKIINKSKISASRQRESPSLSLKSAGEEAVSERACDVFCLDMLKRLRTGDWFEIVNTLDGMSSSLNKFWGYMSEQRIADCIRLICTHIESPRTQVSKSACAALADLLKNTKYTKKPEFYEAISNLLHKTGSFSRQVKRSANLALDKIVCNVDLNHSISALCQHGVDHKSPLVRTAAARLLVVCAALSNAGRELLRTRPAAAATARRQALRALAQLLNDKSTEARKYAERLYVILRPLTHFEAFYLTDVNVELASSQMKKYDQLLMTKKIGAW